jgi:hypothetical protein
MYLQPNAVAIWAIVAPWLLFFMYVLLGEESAIRRLDARETNFETHKSRASDQKRGARGRIKSAVSREDYGTFGQERLIRSRFSVGEMLFTVLVSLLSREPCPGWLCGEVFSLEFVRRRPRYEQLRDQARRAQPVGRDVGFEWDADLGGMTAREILAKAQAAIGEAEAEVQRRAAAALRSSERRKKRSLRAVAGIVRRRCHAVPRDDGPDEDVGSLGGATGRTAITDEVLVRTSEAPRSRRRVRALYWRIVLSDASPLG